MGYTFWDRLTGSNLIARGELMPRCGMCKARVKRRGEPQLFLLPVHHDANYDASAAYYSKVCQPIARVEDIPVGQRACRMWPLMCPKCAARSVLVADFLRVRGQEVTEATVVCDYAPLASLLNGTRPETSPTAPEVQSFTYGESFGAGRR